MLADNSSEQRNRGCITIMQNADRDMGRYPAQGRKAR